MRYYKISNGGYIVAIGTGASGEAINKAEYDGIMVAIQTRPEPAEGYGYRLRTDLTWEAYERDTNDEPPAADEQTGESEGEG